MLLLIDSSNCHCTNFITDEMSAGSTGKSAAKMKATDYHEYTTVLLRFSYYFCSWISIRFHSHFPGEHGLPGYSADEDDGSSGQWW